MIYTWIYYYTVLAASLAGQFAVAADDEAPYWSRTDLQPAMLNVTKNEKDDVSDDYMFIAPWNPGDIEKSQPRIGPHIYNSDGNLVWTGYGFFGNSISNFCPIENHGDNGETSMSYYEGNVGDTGVGFGTYRIMNNKYETTSKVGLSQPFLHDFHEFKMTGSNTAAFSTYRSVPFNFSDVDGATDESIWVFENVVTEINTDTDDVLFEWFSLDHISVNDSVIKQDLDSKGKKSLSPFDYLHLNSIDKDDNGNYLISCRHTWSLYYLDGKTGEILWTLGENNGNNNNWEIEDDAKFAYQHDARWVDAETINKKKEDKVRYMSVFDNSMTGGNGDSFRDYSRGIILKLDSSDGASSQEGKEGKVSLVQEFRLDDDDDDSNSQGSVQVLSNGNVFVGWGSNPKVSEHKLDGSIVFQATIGDGDKASYRAFKSSFEGLPQQKPAVVSLYYKKDDITKVYMSWNGATRVENWKIYSGDDKDNLELVKDNLEHKDFESVYVIKKESKFIKAEAYDSDGKKIGENSGKTYQRFN